MLARCLARSAPSRLASAAAAASARRPAVAARRAVCAASLSADGGDAAAAPPPSVPRQARDSEASAVSLRAVRQKDQVAALQSKLAGEDPAAATPRPTGGAVVLSSDEAGWRELDEKVNDYPDTRVFKGIGTAGGGDRALFEADMVRAVESAVGVTLPPSAVATRDSSGGKYVSVSVEVTVQSGEQVAAVFAAIKREAGARLKWLM